MSKRIGIGMVLLATAGLIACQLQEERHRLALLREIYDFLIHTGYVLGLSGVGVMEYLEGQRMSEPLQRQFELVVGYLRQHRYASGAEAWIVACETCAAALGLTVGQLTLWKDFGNAVFGINQEENLRKLSLITKQWEQQMDKEEEKDRQLCRIRIPVELLGAMMLCVILI